MCGQIGEMLKGSQKHLAGLCRSAATGWWAWLSSSLGYRQGLSHWARHMLNWTGDHPLPGMWCHHHPGRYRWLSLLRWSQEKLWYQPSVASRDRELVWGGTNTSQTHLRSDGLWHFGGVLLGNLHRLGLIKLINFSLYIPFTIRWDKFFAFTI